MEVDLSQFHAIFFEECYEGIESMEKGLLELDPEKADEDLINIIFRAAHSIKGGAGTFGFNDIGNFTHVMETILDEMREGKRIPEKETINLLLEGVDCLRHAVNACKSGSNVDMEVMNEVQSRMQSAISGGKHAYRQIQEEKLKKGAGWRVAFHPYKNLFFTGNDPVRLIKELREIGKLNIKVNISNLPDFDEIEPESSYLGWEILLEGSTTYEEISEIFAWVEGDCDLEIHLQNDRRHRRERRKTEVNFGRRKSDTAGETDSSKEASSIRVAIDKLDAVVDLVGELIINQSMLNREFGSVNIILPEKLRNTLEIQNRLTRSLQEHAMNIRMLPIDFAFQRLSRLVHDLCESLGKKAILNITGKETELDKTVLEKISDPLVHLVRNSLDHGMEQPNERLKAGKPETGTIEVAAYHKGGNIIITISDDGAGLNIEKIRDKAIEKEIINPDEEISEQQIMNLIFIPGFSTATEINDVSGRGVGMDVVNSNIKLLGGAIDVTSIPGQGCTFTIRLPLTMAILDGQLIRVGAQIYIISLLPIVESVQVDPEQLKIITGKSDVYHYRDEYIPVLNLKKFMAGSNEKDLCENLLVVVETGNSRVGLLVDEVIGQQQVVIKSLEQNYQNMSGIAGASILGDGSVALILDVPGLVYNYLQTIH